MERSSHHLASKVAQVTAMFWLLKIIATTLGETFGDFISQTLNLGYVVGLSITGLLLVLVLTAQIRGDRFHPALFWAGIAATTTAGTEISDLMDRTLGLGYTLGAMILAIGLVVTLSIWYVRKQDLSIYPIVDKEKELLFWIAVIFSNSLGTAFGDFLVDVVGLSYSQGALVTMGVIGMVLVLHYMRAASEVLLFWIAFIFTRPFGATFGDFLTKPLAKGGLELGTYNAAAVSLLLMASLIYVSMRRQRAAARIKGN